MQNKFRAIFSILAICVGLFAFSSFQAEAELPMQDVAVLRNAYAQNPDLWPAPQVDSGIIYHEIAIMHKGFSKEQRDSLKHIIKLGRILFHDPRLSGSNQISCGSCHVPDLNWTDGRGFAKGHDHQVVTRNTPTIEHISNNGVYFWDGRAATLEAQVPHSISNPLEMHQDLKTLPKKLTKIKGYLPLFDSAFGTKKINIDLISSAIATYERSIVARKSDFDLFMEGKHDKMSDDAIRGMHLFRTKARCVNCHNGPAFTDNQFHNVGLTYYQREKYEDLGRYAITQKNEDVGKFKTPTLRNVMYTSPWFHNGLFGEIDGVLNMYNAGMPDVKRKPEQMDDPKFPVKSKHLQELKLTKEEKEYLKAFLWAISVKSIRESQPELPQ